MQIQTIYRMTKEKLKTQLYVKGLLPPHSEGIERRQLQEILWEHYHPGVPLPQYKQKFKKTGRKPVEYAPITTLKGIRDAVQHTLQRARANRPNAVEREMVSGLDQRLQVTLRVLVHGNTGKFIITLKQPGQSDISGLLEANPRHLYTQVATILKVPRKNK